MAFKISTMDFCSFIMGQRIARPLCGGEWEIRIYGAIDDADRARLPGYKVRAVMEQSIFTWPTAEATTNHAGRFTINLQAKASLADHSTIRVALSVFDPDMNDLTGENPTYVEFSFDGFYKKLKEIRLEQDIHVKIPGLAPKKPEIDFPAYLQEQLGDLAPYVKIHTESTLEKWINEGDRFQKMGFDLWCGKDELGNPAFSWIGRTACCSVDGDWDLYVFYPQKNEHDEYWNCHKAQIDAEKGTDYFEIKYTKNAEEIFWEGIKKRLEFNKEQLLNMSK